MRNAVLVALLAAAPVLAQDEPPQGGPEESRIAAVVQNANRGMLAAAGAAVSSVRNSDVKVFARHLLMERQDLGAAFDAYAAQRALSPETSGEPDDVLIEGRDRAVMLVNLEGQAADRAFLDYVQSSQGRLVTRLDQLMVEATDPRLQGYLRSLRDAAERDRDLAGTLKGSR